MEKRRPSLGGGGGEEELAVDIDGKVDRHGTADTKQGRRRKGLTRPFLTTDERSSDCPVDLLAAFACACVFASSLALLLSFSPLLSWGPRGFSEQASPLWHLASPSAELFTLSPLTVFFIETSHTRSICRHKQTAPPKYLPSLGRGSTRGIYLDVEVCSIWCPGTRVV